VAGVFLRVQHEEFGRLMAGQRQKHPDALQNKRGGRYRPLQIVPAGERPLPPCPEGVSEEAQASWVALWSSRLAGAYGDVDVCVLGRWLRYLSDWHAAQADVAAKGWTMKGRRGGDVMNPSVRLMFRLEASMRDIEKNYGMDAMSRLRLGVSLAQPFDPVGALKSATLSEYKKRLGVEE
jgi:P27 family predicted phage terminase small subunit